MTTRNHLKNESLTMRMKMFVCMGRAKRAGAVTLVAVVVSATAQVWAGPLVIDFEGIAPRDPQLGGSYWDPNPGFTADGAAFSDGSYAGFVVSSSTTTGVGGYVYSGSEAEISAQSNGGAGGGVNGSSNFAVAYNDGSFVNLPVGYRPTGVSLTNTATAWYAVLNGLYQANQFVAGDWFRVTFTGFSSVGGSGSITGSPVDFYLADYRAGKSLVVDSWTTIDLSPLGDSKSIVFSFASTDNDPEWGMNTPAYVALDNLTLAPVPEPSAAVILAGALIAGLAVRWVEQRGVSLPAAVRPSRVPRA